MNDLSQEYHCLIGSCANISRTLRDLLTHMRHFHVESTISFTCGLDSCPQVFTRTETYRRHVFCAHKERWNAVHIAPKLCNTPKEDFCYNFNCEMEVEDTLDSAESMYTNFMEWVSEEIMLFKLKLGYKHLLAATVVDSIMTQFKDILSAFKAKFSSCIEQQLVGAKDSFLEFMLTDSLSLDSALCLSPSMELKVLQGLGYVSPVEYEVGEEDLRSDEETEVEDTHDGVDVIEDCETGEVEDYFEGEEESTPEGSSGKDNFQYVPILETLKSYLSHKDVVLSIDKEARMSEAGKIDKMCAGTIMDLHPIFREDTSALRILIYSDEYGVCNMLGPHSTKHKQCGVYMQVNNIETKYASSQSSIFLVLLANYSVIKKYKYNVVFKPLIDDLKILETEGLTVKVDGSVRLFRGGLACVLGDNLTQHSLAMFRMVFSSGKVCRRCMVNYTDVKNIHSEDQCFMRTLEGHRAHVEAVQTDASLSKVYGIVGKPVFNDLQSYNPIISHPPDIMHDVEEGLIPLNLITVIRGLVKGGTLSLEKINQLVKSFPYGHHDKVNKISSVPDKVMAPKPSFPGTASEKHHFFRMMSLILGSYVPEDNVYWSLYNLCNRICDILYAPAIVEEVWLDELTALIADHHKLWDSLPVDVTAKFTPKMHYLIHTPNCIKLYGPLRHIDCKRFEQFHQLLKKTAQRSNNYINIPKTVATRFQKKRCIEHSENALPSSVVTRVTRSQSLNHLPTTEQNAVKLFYGIDRAHLCKVKEVQLYCQKFCENDYVVLNMSNGCPIFFEIKSIYSFDEVWCIYGKLVYIKSWSEHFHAWIINTEMNESDFVCIHPHEVFPLQNLHSYKINGITIIKLHQLPVAA